MDERQKEMEEEKINKVASSWESLEALRERWYTFSYLDRREDEYWYRIGALMKSLSSKKLEKRRNGRETKRNGGKEEINENAWLNSQKFYYNIF